MYCAGLVDKLWFILEQQSIANVSNAASPLQVHTCWC